jgi:hypothetical protein
VDNRWRLTHGSIHWRRHVQVRRHNYGGSVRLRLELARGHRILRGRRWLLIWVPLLHRLHVLGVAVGRAILLEVVVGRGIGVVVPRRVCLGRDVVVVLLLGLPTIWHIGPGHHGQWTRCCLHSRRWQRPSDQLVRQRKSAERRRACSSLFPRRA